MFEITPDMIDVDNLYSAASLAGGPALDFAKRLQSGSTQASDEELLNAVYALVDMKRGLEYEHKNDSELDEEEYQDAIMSIQRDIRTLGELLREGEVKTAENEEDFVVSFGCLCDAYGVPDAEFNKYLETHDTPNDFLVRIFKDPTAPPRHRWKLQSNTPIDADEWAPVNDYQAASIKNKCLDTRVSMTTIKVGEYQYHVATEMLDDFTEAYITAALWSTTDDEGDSLDSNYDIDDVATECLQRMIEDCSAFQHKHGDLFEGREEGAGHDFWLTRNGHGAGFWDGDWEEPTATTLTNASKKFGEVDLYVGDDGMIYCM